MQIDPTTKSSPVLPILPPSSSPPTLTPALEAIGTQNDKAASLQKKTISQLDQQSSVFTKCAQWVVGLFFSSDKENPTSSKETPSIWMKVVDKFATYTIVKFDQPTEYVEKTRKTLIDSGIPESSLNCFKTISRKLPSFLSNALKDPNTYGNRNPNGLITKYLLKKDSNNSWVLNDIGTRANNLLTSNLTSVENFCETVSLGILFSIKNTFSSRDWEKLVTSRGDRATTITKMTELIIENSELKQILPKPILWAVSQIVQWFVSSTLVGPSTPETPTETKATPSSSKPTVSTEIRTLEGDEIEAFTDLAQAIGPSLLPIIPDLAPLQACLSPSNDIGLLRAAVPFINDLIKQSANSSYKETISTLTDGLKKAGVPDHICNFPKEFTGLFIDETKKALQSPEIGKQTIYASFFSPDPPGALNESGQALLDLLSDDTSKNTLEDFVQINALQLATDLLSNEKIKDKSAKEIANYLLNQLLTAIKDIQNAPSLAPNQTKYDFGLVSNSLFDILLNSQKFHVSPFFRTLLLVFQPQVTIIGSYAVEQLIHVLPDLASTVLSKINPKPTASTQTDPKEAVQKPVFEKLSPSKTTSSFIQKIGRVLSIFKKQKPPKISESPSTITYPENDPLKTNMLAIFPDNPQTATSFYQLFYRLLNKLEGKTVPTLLGTLSIMTPQKAVDLLIKNTPITTRRRVSMKSLIELGFKAKRNAAEQRLREIKGDESLALFKGLSCIVQVIFFRLLEKGAKHIVRLYLWKKNEKSDPFNDKALQELARGALHTLATTLSALNTPNTTPPHT